MYSFCHNNNSRRGSAQALLRGGHQRPTVAACEWPSSDTAAIGMPCAVALCFVSSKLELGLQDATLAPTHVHLRPARVHSTQLRTPGHELMLRSVLSCSHYSHVRTDQVRYASPAALCVRGRVLKRRAPSSATAP
jgi:hypothetical protein